MPKVLKALILIGAAAVIGACETAGQDEGGPETTRNFAVGNFSEIESAGPYDIVVTTGGAASVRAKGPESVLSKLRVEVEGDKLEISSGRSGMFNGPSGSKVVIEVTVPELRAASIAGSGNIVVDKVTGKAFEANIAGSGDLDLPAVDVTSAEFTIAGSGNATATGKATSVRYRIAGSGTVDSSRLRSQDVEVEITGSGSVTAQATGTVDGTIVGSGSVAVTGGAKCTVKKMGSGSITCA